MTVSKVACPIATGVTVNLRLGLVQNHIRYHSDRCGYSEFPSTIKVTVDLGFETPTFLRTDALSIWPPPVAVVKTQRALYLVCCLLFD